MIKGVLEFKFLKKNVLHWEIGWLVKSLTLGGPSYWNLLEGRLGGPGFFWRETLIIIRGQHGGPFKTREELFALFLRGKGSFGWIGPLFVPREETNWRQNGVKIGVSLGALNWEGGLI